MQLLLALHDLGTVLAAAEQLEISQSSASYGLDKLRRAFADPLFVRQGAGMAATARGAEAAAHCASMLQGLEALASPARFDPATSNRTFRVAATTYEIFGLLTGTYQALHRIAPHVVLHVDDIDNTNAVEQLNTRWDILLTPYVPQTGGLKQRTLLEDTYSVFYDPDHAEPPDSIEKLAAAALAMMIRPDTSSPTSARNRHRVRNSDSANRRQDSSSKSAGSNSGALRARYIGGAATRYQSPGAMSAM